MSETNVGALSFPRPSALNGERPRINVDGAVSYAVNAFIALSLLIFVAPLLIVVAAVIYLQDGGPIIFAHERIGEGGLIFRCLKFRSMAVDANLRLRKLLEEDPEARAEWAHRHKLKNDPRITPFGSFLRKSSIDEFPQLINVLRGEMSLVGPRPIVPAEAHRYGRRFETYCEVLPGITGLWQISGRSDTNYNQRIALDTLYVRRKSLMEDARILLLTVPVVLLRKGSY